MTRDPVLDPSLLNELADLGTTLAREAGAVALDLASSARTSTSTKSSATDLVTEADAVAERVITAGILAARPDDSILGEEGASHSGTGPVLWHVDPIDGTTNYVYGIGAFSVSIAAEMADRVVAGVVFNPSTGELFRATLNGGATLDGERLACRDHPDLSTALVATGFGYRPELRRRQAEVLVELLPRIRDIRRFGSAALDLCAVAAGRVDAYYERGLSRWDLAAGALVAAESGAVVTNLRRGPPDAGFALAAGPTIHGRLRQVLSELDADTDP